MTENTSHLLTTFCHLFRMVSSSLQEKCSTIQKISMGPVLYITIVVNIVFQGTLVLKRLGHIISSKRVIVQEKM